MANKLNNIGVIPARYASTRLPGKPLMVLAGKPLIQWVWEAACRCETLDRVLVATDDRRILDCCRGFGAECVMTPADCPSGSDRIAAAVAGSDAEIIANIQGDEPLLEAGTVDACVRALIADPAAGVASAMTRFPPDEDASAPHAVKVVTDESGCAMYFSRALIPDTSRLTAQERETAPPPMKHAGLYVYRRAALEKFISRPPSRYEMLEKLEQLRLLEAGIRIRMIETASGSIGVDTPEDAAAVEKLLRS